MKNKIHAHSCTQSENTVVCGKLQYFAVVLFTNTTEDFTIPHLYRILPWSVKYRVAVLPRTPLALGLPSRWGCLDQSEALFWGQKREWKAVPVTPSRQARGNRGRYSSATLPPLLQQFHSLAWWLVTNRIKKQVLLRAPPLPTSSATRFHERPLTRASAIYPHTQSAVFTIDLQILEL